MNEQFAVVFQGGVRQGFTREKVKADLLKFLKQSPQSADKLFSGHTVTLRSGGDPAAIRKFATAVTQLGAQVQVHRVAASANSKPPTAGPTDNGKGSAPQPLPSANDDQPADVDDKEPSNWRGTLGRLLPGASEESGDGAVSSAPGRRQRFQYKCATLGARLNHKLDNLIGRDGPVVEQDHVIIWGWHPVRVPAMIRQLGLQGVVCVVVLVDADERGVRETLARSRGLPRTVVRSAPAGDAEDLKRVALQHSRAVIVPAVCDTAADSGQKTASDNRALQCLLALCEALPAKAGTTLVAELYDRGHRDIISERFGRRVDCHAPTAIPARLLMQAARSPGLSAACHELMATGATLRYVPHKWRGENFGDQAYHFHHGVPVGLRRRSGAPVFNPSPDTTLQNGDELLVLTPESGEITYHRKPVVSPKPLVLADSKLRLLTERVLVLGWSGAIPLLAHEFAQSAPQNSQLDIAVVSTNPDQQRQIAALNKALPRIKLALNEVNYLNRTRLQQLKPEQYQSIVLLAETGNAQTDANTTACLMLLQHILAGGKQSGRLPALVAETTDLRRRPLMAKAGANDVVATGDWSSWYSARCARDKPLQPVLDKLFGDRDHGLQLKPATLYFEQFPATVSYADMIALAQQRNEICLGIRVKADEKNPQRHYGVHLMPEKNRHYRVSFEDSLILVGKGDK